MTQRQGRATPANQATTRGQAAPRGAGLFFDHQPGIERVRLTPKGYAYLRRLDARDGKQRR